MFTEEFLNLILLQINCISGHTTAIKRNMWELQKAIYVYGELNKTNNCLKGSSESITQCQVSQS